jgi:hydrogenase maturation protein HypF
VLFEILDDKVPGLDKIAPIESLSEYEMRILIRMLSKGINSPVTSSCGRVFDAVASLLGVCQINEYEGQAAMALGFLAEKCVVNETYPYEIDTSIIPFTIDWRPLLRSMLDDISRSVPNGAVAGKFHNTLCEMIVDLANNIGHEQIVLSGGCFQNRYLSERAIDRLRQEGFKPYWHHRIPPNDGGIAAGQILALARERKSRR